MKKTNKGLLITLIVLLCIIAILLSGILIFAMVGGASTLPKIHSVIPSRTTVIFDESYDANEVKKISVDNNAGDITIKTTNDGKVRLVAEGFSDKNFSAAVDGDTLNATGYQLNKSDILDFNSKRGTEITLYIPKDFESLDIATDFGDVDIEGALNTTLTINNDMGDINIAALSGSFNLHTDMGNIEIKRANITENSTVTTDMGDIDIEQANAVNIYAKTSMGECDIKNSDPSSPVTLTAETSMGDIEIND